MSSLEIVLLWIAGLVAGTIDSIAGGGGLITVPALMIVLGPGPLAIGSNKIAGLLAASTALVVYRRRSPGVSWRSMLWFAGWVAAGSVLGSQVGSSVPKEAFRWFLVLTCPLILWIVWNRKLWLKVDAKPLEEDRALGRLAIAGLACGFYDGVWGPGGGTFMLLSLLFYAHQPLLLALLESKFANAVSAGAALGGYAIRGHVQVLPGIVIGLGTVAGATLGARFASERASRVVRPALVVVTLLLLLRVFTSS